jgi:exodeoxyribonuclease VII large subunit
VRGEISGFKAAASGHLYFNLKEEDTILPCALYRQNARLAKISLRDGMLIDARGSIDVYEPRGAYQFIVEHVAGAGVGNLQQAFEELKAKLASEGMFESSRKRSLPRFPRRIGIVTSPTGAVLQDMLQILERRSRGLHIQVFPALVQGAGSVEDVCAGLRHFSDNGWADLVIVARGGGSLEDLWTFNEEAVARAIAGCSIPVVAAIGHETDFTIADFVADLRASTPSAAAEIVAPPNQSVLDAVEVLSSSMERTIILRIAQLRERTLQLGTDRPAAILIRRLNTILQRCDELEAIQAETMRHAVKQATERLTDEERRLWRSSPVQRLSALAASAALLSAGLQAGIEKQLERLKERRALNEARLGLLSPVATLARGYAIVQNAKGTLVTDAARIELGETVRIRLASGKLEATVSGKPEATPSDSLELPS